MAEWDQGSSDCVMGWGNQGMVPLEFGCTVRLHVNSGIHSEKDNSSVVIWLAHAIVITKVRIQTSE